MYEKLFKPEPQDTAKHRFETGFKNPFEIENEEYTIVHKPEKDLVPGSPEAEAEAIRELTRRRKFQSPFIGHPLGPPHLKLDSNKKIEEKPQHHQKPPTLKKEETITIFDQEIRNKKLYNYHTLQEEPMPETIIRRVDEKKLRKLRTKEQKTWNTLKSWKRTGKLLYRLESQVDNLTDGIKSKTLLRMAGWVNKLGDKYNAKEDQIEEELFTIRNQIDEIETNMNRCVGETSHTSTCGMSTENIRSDEPSQRNQQTGANHDTT